MISISVMPTPYMHPPIEAQNPEKREIFLTDQVAAAPRPLTIHLADFQTHSKLASLLLDLNAARKVSLPHAR